MMFPLCTRVTLSRFCSIAYLIAARMRRWLPSIETGLIPKALVPGKRMLFTFMVPVRNSRTCFASGLPLSNSIPA